MKKNVWFAAAVAAAFTACSNESVEQTAWTGAGDGDRVPIELGLNRFGVSVSESQRGTGTVGGINPEENIFNNEDIYVLMTSIDSRTWGYQDCGGDLGQPFSNVLCKPVLNAGSWILDYSAASNGAKKYYPMSGQSDFFAYHFDDKVNDADPGTNVVLDANAGEAVLSFVMDGSQDLMAGKADDGSTPENQTRVGYSAKTARQGVIPTITLKHLLSRLTFELVSGTSGNAEGLKINKIEVLSKNQGDMVVAYNQVGEKSVDELIRWTNDAPEYLVLKERQGAITDSNGKKTHLQAMTPITMGTDGFTQTVNGALFVAPQTGRYEMKIYFSYPYTSETGVTSYYDTEQVLYIGTSNTTFAAGKSYHVKVTVYGYSEIRVNAALEPWEAGDDIDIDCAEPLE